MSTRNGKGIGPKGEIFLDFGEGWQSNDAFLSDPEAKKFKGALDVLFDMKEGGTKPGIEYSTRRFINKSYFLNCFTMRII